MARWFADVLERGTCRTETMTFRSHARVLCLWDWIACRWPPARRFAAGTVTVVSVATACSCGHVRPADAFRASLTDEVHDMWLLRERLANEMSLGELEKLWAEVDRRAEAFRAGHPPMIRIRIDPSVDETQPAQQAAALREQAHRLTLRAYKAGEKGRPRSDPEVRPGKP